jgi:hypothetical protein
MKHRARYIATGNEVGKNCHYGLKKADNTDNLYYFKIESKNNYHKMMV